MSRKCLILAVLVALIVGPLAASGCKPVAPVTWRLYGEVSTLNPLMSSDGTAELFNYFVREFLGIVRPDGTWEGRLATDYSVSADGLTYTFKLRKGVKWHDGQPFTADDVVFTFDLVANAETKSVFRSRVLVGGQPLKWAKVDDYTVTMTIPKKSATVLENLHGITMVPKHLLKDVAPKDFATCEYSRSPILTGPYKFVEYKTGDYVKFEAFKDYWGGKPLLDQIILRIIPDEAAAVVALESGQIDVTTVSAGVAKRLREGGKVQVYQGPGSGVTFIGLNNKVFPFDDVKVRQAMNYALNRAGLVEQVYLGSATPAYSFLNPNDFFYNGAVVTKYGFNLDTARGLLTADGWTAGADGTLAKNGKKLEFEIIYTSGDATAEKALLIYQSDLAKIGVKAQIRAIEGASFVRIFTAGHPLPYQAMFRTMSPGPEPDSYSIVYHGAHYPPGTTGWNYIAYVNDRVSELFDLGKAELVSSKRAEYYAEIQELVSEDAAIVPVVYADGLLATSKRVDISTEAKMAPTANGVSRLTRPGKISVKK